MRGKEFHVKSYVIFLVEFLSAIPCLTRDSIMGYTHYWYFPSTYEVDTKTWKKIVDDFNKILDVKNWSPTSSISILRDILEQKSGQKLAITDDMIWFNGREENDQGHETFHLERKSTKESFRTFPLKNQDGKILEDTEKEEIFTFCKTSI